jgi:Ca2+-binding RTX toxin-like protein
MKRFAQLLVVVGSVWLSIGTASAQSAATCSFNAESATLTVSLNGTPASITRTGPGQIRLDNVACTGATVTTTDFIQVNGGGLLDQLTVTGSFAPGLTAEGDGASEIEWGFALGGDNDFVRFNLTDAADTLMFRSNGIDVGLDFDVDIVTAGVDRVKIYGLDGDDTIDASDYVGGGNLYLYGGNGADTIAGSVQADFLYGQAGNDFLSGDEGVDRLTGGADNDQISAGPGNDTITSDAVADGDDTYSGGDGVDTVTYSKRSVAVSVSIGNGLADDGQVGEFDNVDDTVENVIGGGGDDTLVGSAGNNALTGNDGDDDVFGGGGRDTLTGGNGNDILVGDAGPDLLFGDAGIDSLDGGTGNDELHGGTSNDTLTGGTGADLFFGDAGNDVFFNNDGTADTVDCGAGIQDDPEPDSFDTFIACENI